jgi:predicted RecA/RadA family phage recombinase
MAKTHVQEGKVMTWTNGTGSAVVAGEVVAVGTVIGVALGNIASGATGELAIEEVWTLPKEAPLVITQGDKVYWDDTNNRIDKTDTNVYAGKAFVSAVSAATTVVVKINV